jgi:multidrug efflux pump subunit AcrA (membrane-fusion protein)
VPQSSALSIKAGDPAQVNIPERPGRPFTAKVARTAGAVDPASRSLLVEVELSNHEAKLPPGVYAHIRFQSTGDQTGWIIPAQTLLMRSNGTHVATVGSDNLVRLQLVTIGRDWGTTVEALVGLQGNERLVVNPSDDLRDGQPVSIADNVAAGTQIARK